MRAGDVEAARLLLQELTLNKGGLRDELLGAAAAAGQLPMLQLLLESSDGSVDAHHDDCTVVLALARSGRLSLLPALAAATQRVTLPSAAAEVATQVLRPNAECILWALHTLKPGLVNMMVRAAGWAATPRKSPANTAACSRHAV